MNNILKLCLVIVLCGALLMMVGCAKEQTGDNDSTQQTTQGTTEGNGSEDEVDQEVTKNPEGDPFDATTEGTEPNSNTGNGGNGGNSGNGGNGGNGSDKTPTETTEPPVGIDEDTKPTEDDFNVNFGDLLG